MKAATSTTSGPWPELPGLGSALRRTAGPLTSLRLLGQGLEFAAFVLFARALGPSTFGALSVAYLGCRYLGLVADWGATVRGTRDVAASAHADTIDALMRWRERLAAGLAVAFAVAMVAIGRPELAPLALTILSRGASRDWIALGNGRGARAATPQVVQGAIALIVALAASDLGEAAAGLSIAAAASLACSLLLNRRRTSATARPIGGWYLVVLVADQVSATADVVLLSLLRSTAEAGVYAAMYRLPNAWITVQGLLVGGLLPWVTRASLDAPGGLRHLWRRSRQLGVGLAALVLACTPVLVWFVTTLYGSAYRSGRAALAILLVGVAASTIGASVQPLTFALGRDLHLARWYAIAAVANITMNLWAIPTFGATGAAVVTALTLAATSAYLVRATRGLVARAEGGVRAH